MSNTLVPMSAPTSLWNRGNFSSRSMTREDVPITSTAWMLKAEQSLTASPVTIVSEGVPPYILLLPAELRAMVYEKILSSIPKTPYPALLRDYRGLVLSCQQLKEEFEHEWAKAFNASVCSSLQNLEEALRCKFRADHVHSFRDTKKELRITVYGSPAKIQFGISAHEDFATWWDARKAAMKLFRRHLHITFKLPSPVPDRHLPTREYFESEQFHWLTSLRYALPYNMGSYLDYWKHELHCVPLTLIADLEDEDDAWRKMPGEVWNEHRLPRVLSLVQKWTFASCETMEELEEYRGLFMASVAAQLDLEESL